MNRQLTKSSAKLDQIFGRDILVAEDDQLVLDQRVVERLELLVRQRPAKINAADLRAQMDADFRHGDAGRLRADRLVLVEFEWLVHGAILPETRAYPCARAASGHATAAPPSKARNSRRPMVTVIRHS